MMKKKKKRMKTHYYLFQHNPYYRLCRTLSECNRVTSGTT